jgi:hypothetical protein
MSGSRLLAGLFGLVLIGLALSDAGKLHIWTNIPAPVAYLSSAVLFAGGLIIVLVHNRWTGTWHIALLGWLAMVGGLAWHITLLGWHAVVLALARFIMAPWGGWVRVGITSSSDQLAQIDLLLASGMFLTFAAYGFKQRSE